MADRVVENQDNEVPEIPEILEKVLLFSLDEAKQKLSQSNEVVPFTALAVKENLFIENHPGEFQRSSPYGAACPGRAGLCSLLRRLRRG